MISRRPIFVLLLLCIAGLSAARATFVAAGDGILFNPGFTRTEPVVVIDRAVVILTGPGTYTATSWSISGEVRLATPGNYFIIASGGTVALNGSAVIRGPAGASGGVANLSFAHAGAFIMSTPTIDPSVTIVRGAPLPPEEPPLLNISTRVTLAAGQTHTSGFVVGGRVARRVLVRAVGPALAMFGVTNPLPTPTLTVLNSRGVVGTNSGWTANGELIFGFTRVGAFALPINSHDAAMMLLIEPGGYTVQVSGGAGEVLLEIYHVE
jgi:hypothetical protein